MEVWLTTSREPRESTCPQAGRRILQSRCGLSLAPSISGATFARAKPPWQASETGRLPKTGALSRTSDAQSRFALVAVAAGGGARASMRDDRDDGGVIEVVLRNGRILRLPKDAAPTRVAPLADALEACGS